MSRFVMLSAVHWSTPNGGGIVGKDRVIEIDPTSSVIRGVSSWQERGIMAPVADDTPITFTRTLAACGGEYTDDTLGEARAERAVGFPFGECDELHTILAGGES